MGFVKQITGPGVTDRVNMISADLGIARWDEKRKANAVMFGDNFSARYLRGEWQSPSIVMYDNDYNLLGIPSGTTGIISEGNRRQLWDYPHANPEYTTILPCDFIKVGDWWYVAAMVTAGLGNELRTVFWRSHDLVNWEKTDPYIRLDHQHDHPGNTMLTFDRLGDYVYTFGTGGLRRDRGIWMWRTKASEFPYAWFEPWGYDGRKWGWGIANENTPILQGRFGELCFRAVQGNCVLSFFDSGEYRQTALTVAQPEGDWTKANRCDYAHGNQFPQLYGGYVTPDSRLNEPNGMKFLVSQWNTQSNDPYHVILFADTLQAQGPLVEPEPVPEPVPEPDPEPEEPLPVPEPAPDPVPTSPQELYELLLKELSASGSTVITTPEGQRLSLREAVGALYSQSFEPHTLAGRPDHPSQSDNQLGHVLSARAEGLYNQALLVALADKAGIDTAVLYDDVQRSLS